MTATSDLIQKLYIGYFGRAGDPSGLQYWVERKTAGMSDAAIAQSFSVQTEATSMYGYLAAPSLGMGQDAFLEAVYQNLFERSIEAGGLTYWKGQLASGRPVGSIILDIINGAVGSDATTVANKLSVANYYTEKVISANATWTLADDQADAISVIANVTSSDSTVTTGKALADTLVAADTAPSSMTVTLSTGVDSAVGGAGNDIFNAAYGTSATFQSNDTVIGGAGTDQLNIGVGAASTYVLGNVSGVETVAGTFSAAGTLSLTGSADITKVVASGGTAAAAFTNISSKSVIARVEDNTQSASFTYTATALNGTADEVSVQLSASTAGTVTVDVASGTNGVEILNIASTGASNTATIDDGAGVGLRTVNVTGDQNFSMTLTPTTVTRIDASALTAGLTHTLVGTAATTVLGGTGNDSITGGAAAVNDSINAGAGNDTVVYTANLTTSDTINGGDGTDTFATTSAQFAAYTAPASAKLTNFEILKVTDALGASLTAETIQASGIDTVTLAAGSGAFTVTMGAGTKTVNIGASNTGTLTVSDTGEATTDVLYVKNSATTAVDMFNATALTVNGYEAVNIVSTNYDGTEAQDLGVLTLAGDGGTTRVNFSGTNKVTTTGTITAGIIDASGLTAASSGSTFTMSTAATSVTSIIGSAGNDTLVGDSSSNIDGGAGNDGITGGSGNDTLSGGDGADTITAGAGNDSINGGSGNDSIVMAGNIGTAALNEDIIDGGDGVDTLSLTNASLTVLNAASVSGATLFNNSVSNVERVTITDDLDQTSFDMGRLDNINYIRITDWAGAEALTGLAANTTVVLDDTGGGTSAANDLTLTLADATGSSDTLNIKLEYSTGDLNHGDITIDDIENLTIDTLEATATSTVNVLVLDVTDSSELRTLTITGTEALNLSGVAIRATTIDASASTGQVNILGTGAAQSITGTNATAAGDTINGGAGADTISGLAGADSLVGGTGADSITGGTGADTITGGAGNDTIVLTETSAAVDDVYLDYANGGADVDTVVGFTTGSSGDEVQLDRAALETAGTSGIDSAVTDFVLLGAAAATSTAAGAAVVQSFTEAGTVNTTASVLVLRGATLASVSDVEDALETGGAFELTIDADADVAQNAFIVVYTDGTNAYIASARIASVGAADTNFETGDLDVQNLAVLQGVTSISSTTFGAANFEWI